MVGIAVRPAIGEPPASGELPTADRFVVYFDYAEAGRLQGGRRVLDRNDPRVQEAFGLGPLDEVDRAAQGGWAVTTIIDNGPIGNRVNLVLLGDGYTVSELGLYATRVDSVLNVFFAEEPLAAYAAYYNVHRVDVISTESGVDEIDLNIYRDTA